MKKFRNSINGYDKRDVIDFVNEVTKEFESMLSKLKNQDTEIKTLNEKLDYYKNLEGTLNKAIQVADDASNQIKRVAREESTSMMEEAKRNASRIINDALLKAEKTDAEAEMLKRRVNVFKKRLRSIIEDQLSEIERIDENDL